LQCSITVTVKLEYENIKTIAIAQSKAVKVWKKAVKITAGLRVPTKPSWPPTTGILLWAVLYKQT